VIENEGELGMKVLFFCLVKVKMVKRKKKK